MGQLCGQGYRGVSGVEKSEDKERREGKQNGALGGQQKT